MKKLLLVILIATISFTSFAEGIEIRSGIDFSGNSDYSIEDSDKLSLDETSGELDPGYVLKVEYLFGETFEYGVGLAYKELGESDAIDTMNSVSVSGSLLSSTILYGTVKYNLGIEGMQPYIKGNLGLTSSTSKLWSGSISTAANYEISYDPGIYYGLGFGVEYNNYIIELIQEVQTVMIKEDGSDLVELTASTTTLEFGYKFGA